MTQAMKEAQIRIAEENLAELTGSQTAAQQRVAYYEQLIAGGLSALEQTQLDLMATAAASHFASSVLKVAAGIAHVAPEVFIGPFIIGLEEGGRHIGDALDK